MRAVLAKIIRVFDNYNVVGVKTHGLMSQPSTELSIYLNNFKQNN